MPPSANVSHHKAPGVLVRAALTKLVLALTVGTGALILSRSPLPRFSSAAALGSVGEVILGVAAGLVLAAATARAIARHAANAVTGGRRARTDCRDALPDVQSTLSRVVFVLVMCNLLGYALGYIIGYALVNLLAAMTIYKMVVRQDENVAEEVPRLVSAWPANSADGVLLFAAFVLLQAGLGLRGAVQWAPPMIGGLLLATFSVAAIHEAYGRLARKGQAEPTWAVLLPSAMLMLAGILGFARVLTSGRLV